MPWQATGQRSPPMSKWVSNSWALPPQMARRSAHVNAPITPSTPQRILCGEGSLSWTRIEIAPQNRMRTFLRDHVDLQASLSVGGYQPRVDLSRVHLEQTHQDRLLTAPLLPRFQSKHRLTRPQSRTCSQQGLVPIIERFVPRSIRLGPWIQGRVGRDVRAFT